MISAFTSKMQFYGKPVRSMETTGVFRADDDAFHAAHCSIFHRYTYIAVCCLRLELRSQIHYRDVCGHRRQTVGRAGSIGHHIHVRRVFVVVDAHDEGRRLRVLRRVGDDEFLRAVPEMDGGPFRRQILPGGFDDVFGVAVIPGNLRCIGIAVDASLLSVDDQALAVALHVAHKGAEHGVVFGLTDHKVGICVAEVDAGDML